MTLTSSDAKAANPFTVADFRTWVSAIVVLGFFAAYALNWWRNDQKALDLMNGAMIAQFTGVVGYWLGSSRSSDAKSGTIETLATKSLESPTP
jgi:hypothetical protein